MKTFIASIMVLLAFSAQAESEQTQSIEPQTLHVQSFEDQWEKPIELNQQVKWLVISQAKDAGKVVKESFDTLQLADLNQYQLLYIADISGMPGFVTKMFALPKMRDNAFRMALIKQEGLLNKMQIAGLDKEFVTVLTLDGLKVRNTQVFRDQATFTSFLQTQVLKIAK
ncbi:hypothetical protein THMIRHAM_01760 [Thiomicrorhabdus immobilis]|uniref:Uncharacterized protein n=1 Tax=Thiomicrorhabdus immobilis TaxID=2791037 RepID=A0ABN6CTX9_9GAMM|nr:hypothetical protein [Thiomicrorhabdus immobilis]BCN92391.1 hypothetical protein THMIRHAM_01760 [Thiomicrorhabdus immobilis]